LRHTKKDLIKILQTNQALSEFQAKQVVKTVFDVIATAMQNGDTYLIMDFGTFQVRENKPGMRNNIRAGTTFWKAKSKRPHLKFSPTLKKFINAGSN